jgi:hypothetical protein
MSDMYADARATRDRLESVALAARRREPSLTYADCPREVPSRQIRIDEAAQRLANALHLHLD